jgi:hypothetical protein
MSTAINNTNHTANVDLTYQADPQHLDVGTRIVSVSGAVPVRVPSASVFRVLSMLG